MGLECWVDRERNGRAIVLAGGPLGKIRGVGCGGGFDSRSLCGRALGWGSWGSDEEPLLQGGGWLNMTVGVVNLSLMIMIIIKMVDSHCFDHTVY